MSAVERSRSVLRGANKKSLEGQHHSAQARIFIYSYITHTSALLKSDSVRGRRPDSASHSPTLDSILMVEAAIKQSNTPPSKVQLWRSLPRRMMYQTFQSIVQYLEASNKIIFDGRRRIVWVAVDNPKLEALIRTGVRLRG